MMSMTWKEINPLARPQISRVTERVLEAAIDRPWASASDLAGATHLAVPHVHRALEELERAEIMAPFRDSSGAELKLSASSMRVTRWRLINSWPERLDAPLHQDWGLAYLLQRFPLVERFYPAANQLQDDSGDDPKQGLGRPIQFKWFQGAPWDAAVRYEKGWAAIFFSGILETEAHLRDRMVRLGPELMECTLTTAAYSDNIWAWPGLLVFVVPDQWQRELVRRVAGSYNFASQVQVRCISDNSVEGPEVLGTSSKWVGREPWPTEMGGWTLEQRLGSSLWLRKDSATIYHVLLALAEWPDSNTSFIRAYCRSRCDTQKLKSTLKYLHNQNFLSRVKDGKSYLYKLAGRAIDLLSRVEWIYGDDIPAAVGGAGARIAVHERQLRSSAEKFLDNGIPVHAGWRCRDHWGSGGIDPDAVILVQSGPYGPGWHMFEYERSARGKSGATKKLDGYMSNPRRRKCPAIFAVRDSTMEEHLHAVARDKQLPLLTTTFPRLKSCNVVGNTGCWSQYGKPVSLG